MVDILPIAVSGMNAASRKLAVSASNTVNARSTKPVEKGEAVDPARVTAAYRAQDVDFTSAPGGGVRAVSRERSPSAYVGADPSSPTGYSAFPNVDYVEEAVTQKQAALQYKAAASLVRTQEDMDRALLSAFDK